MGAPHWAIMSFSTHDWSCCGVQSRTGYRCGHRITNQLDLRQKRQILGQEVCRMAEVLGFR
eukprot:5921762-Prymnesium_polylepis.1